MNHINKKITAILVDDEKRACINLENILSKYTGDNIYIAGMANNTAEAQVLIAQHQPDVVFLDIEMPRENAFEFLDRIAPVPFEVIFVTAYDEYALKAFKLNALDYILKPIDIDEIMLCVRKIRERMNYKRLLAPDAVSYTQLRQQVEQHNMPARITFRSLNSIDMVEFRDIHFLEAQSSYSRVVYTKGAETCELVVSSPLSDYEELLPVTQFYRIHRSYIVNCARISRVLSGENHFICLDTKQELPVSRRRFIALKQFLKDNNFIND